MANGLIQCATCGQFIAEQTISLPASDYADLVKRVEAFDGQRGTSVH